MKETTLCYLLRDGKVLMLHRVKKQQDINAGKWIGVGGHLEAGETPEMCLQREVREETGYVLGKADFRGIVDFVPDTAEEERMYLYTAEDFSGEELADCDEGILRWIPEEEILSLSLWEGDRIFLRLLREGRSGFYLKLVYEGDTLAGSQLDEHGAAGRLEE